MVTSNEMTRNKPIADGYGNTVAAWQAFFSQESFWSEQQVKKFMFCQIKKFNSSKKVLFLLLFRLYLI